jgi:hypothetical protein
MSNINLLFKRTSILQSLRKIIFDNGYVTFVSRKKLERFICTISGQLTGVALEDPDLGLDRIGSHIEENFIGNMRSICHGDDRIDNMKHQMARFKLARIEVESKIAKRVNLKGSHSGEATRSRLYLRALLLLLLQNC